MKLLDQVRREIRVRHYAHATEKSYWHWIKRFILYHGKRHPNTMGAEQVADYLSYLAPMFWRGLGQQMAAAIQRKLKILSTTAQRLVLRLLSYKRILNSLPGQLATLCQSLKHLIPYLMVWSITQSFSINSNKSCCLFCTINGETVVGSKSGNHIVNSKTPLTINFIVEQEIQIQISAQLKTLILQPPASRIGKNACFNEKDALTKNVTYPTNLCTLNYVEKINMSPYKRARTKLYLFGILSRIYADLISEEFSGNIESIESYNALQRFSDVKKAKNIIKKILPPHPTHKFL